MANIVLTEEEFLELRNENAGVCKNCGHINYDFHEPDAEDYPCEECEENASMGMEQALICGVVDF